MTSQKDQIQRLIAEIEATLAKPAARLPLGLSGDAERQRQLLTKLSTYLQSLQEGFEAPGGWGPLDPDTGQLVASPRSAPDDIEESASQVLQGLLSEMRYLRENSLKPMRQELESLQQKRDSLQTEINVLEVQRNTGSPLESEAQISAFLETLMKRLQEQLSTQMVQNLAAMEAATVEQLSVTDHPQPLLSGQRLEQVRLLQAQSDQLLLKLDTTLTAVFDSLQKSVDSYRESLEEGLDQMHGLGRQGEVIFHAFINHLAQQLGQDASSYLTGEMGTPSAVLQNPESGTTDVELDAVQLNELDQALENLALEEEFGNDDVDPDLKIDPDLALLENEIALTVTSDGIGSNTDDDNITVNDLGTVFEVPLLEEELDLDGDITVVQADDFGLAANQDSDINLDEEITILQTEHQPDPDLVLLEEAISSSGITPTTSKIDLSNPTDNLALEEDTPLEKFPLFDEELGRDDGGDHPLDTDLETIDENFGLLAIGTNEVDLLSVANTDVPISGDPVSGDTLPQPEAEGELFNFDTDFDTDVDLGLTPTEPGNEPSNIFEGSMIPGQSANSDELASAQQGSSPLSDDLLAFSFANDPEIEHPLSRTDEPLTETELLDAHQVANDWLFEQASSETDHDLENELEAGTILGELGENLLEIDSEELPEIDQDSLSEETTVQNLFGDNLVPQPGASELELGKDTVSSLSEILPDPLPSNRVEDLPDNVPDDVYIAASPDEDLINLVEPGSEQRLLISFDDGQLAEQLDKDLQKLAGETISADSDMEEETGFDLLDQEMALETIVRDLEFEDLDLDDVSASTDISSVADSISSLDLGSPDAVMSEVNSIEDERGPDTDFDLFEGFASDSIDIDHPSADEDIKASSISFLPVADVGSPDVVDILGLATEPLVDEFDDDIPDSLADELGDLNAQAETISQKSTEHAIGQILSDLEEPVLLDDEVLAVPTLENMEPHLDSSSTPDLPSDSDGKSDFSLDDLSISSPESDDFLQAEQEAFWQTVDEDAVDQFSVQLDDKTGDDDVLNIVSASVQETVMSDDNDLDDLLTLDDRSTSQAEAVHGDELDLGDLDELFGQAPLLDLDAELDPDDRQASVDVPQIVDPLTELGLEPATIAPETKLPEVRPLSGEPVLPEVIADIPPPSTANVPPVIDLASDGDGNIASLSPVTVPPDVSPPADLEGNWFLGLDVGSTGLSAVLMNQRTGQVYPLYWQIEAEETKHFRLPAMAIMTAAQDTVAVGYDALGDLEELLDQFDMSVPTLIGVNRLKPLLKVAVGHGQTLLNSDPWVRWSDVVELPILQVLQAMVALFKYLVEQGQAVGLDSGSLTEVWAKLQGVIVGYPTNWPDTYSFNLREAVLAAGLIHQPEQIFFVEDAIATILSGLPDPKDVSVSDTVSLSRQASLYSCQWQDGTVVISGGATMTELGLVNLPKDLASLDYADFALRSFAYAGDALDQDIICQLLLPEDRRQPLSATETNVVWDWQGHLSPEDADWNQLNLNNLSLPAVGHVDWAQRYRLQQRLLKSNLGQSLLAAARHLKLALQQQSQVQITLAGQHWLIKRRHLENMIFLPYIQRINRYLNVLLSHHTVDAQSIKQVICTGGSASLPAIARWLRQKFPNATIIQDTYASELPQSCSRVAYGLVNLSRYSRVLNITRQQYSDYFLLMELLRVFPQQPLPVGAIMHLLEQRGINTQACHLHILALLEGHLPPGLVPTAADRGLICDRTNDLPTYRALLQTPLFSKTVTESGGHIYIPNEGQAERLRAYFNQLLIDKVQTLEEPLIAQLEVLA